MLLTNFHNLFDVVFGGVIAVLNYRNTERYRRATGKSPWGIPPIGWAVASAFVPVVVTFMALIAMTSGRGARRGSRPFGGTMPGSAARPPFDGQVPDPPTGYRPGELPDAALHPSGQRSTDRQTEAAVPATLTASASAPPSWQADPSGRFDFRNWGGDEWTEFVSKGGEQSTDPF